MCGISGSYGFGADTEGIARRMAGALAHDGARTVPEDEALVVTDQAALVHSEPNDRSPDRTQPMASSDGRYTIVHDGEVHNHRELRTQLEQLGHSFRTDTATEVVLAAHAQWGTAAYDRFNGMFALAIHDTQTGELVLARDQVGIKPLYYWLGDGGRGPQLLFASEISALLAAEQFEAAPDDRTVYRYLQFGVHDEDSRTFFDGVRRLLPGQVLRVSTDSTGNTGSTGSTASAEVTEFSSLQEELRRIAARPGRPVDQDTVAEYRERFERAIRLRLPSDGTVGTSVSGDLGSSAIAAVIARRLREEPDDEAYSAVGARQHVLRATPTGAVDQDASDVDSLLADYQGQIAAHEVRTGAGDDLEDLREAVRAQGEPAASSAPYARYAVLREAGQHVTALLDGLGASQTMAGDERHHRVYLRQLRRQRRLGPLARELAASRDLLRAAARRGSGRAAVPVDALLNSGFVEEHSAETLSLVQDDLKQRLLEDVFRTSLPALLREHDRFSRRSGVQGRLPFLDKELLAFLFSLEESAFLAGGRGCGILRETMDGVVPGASTDHRGRHDADAGAAAAGVLASAEDEWLRALGPDVREIFASESFADRPYVDAPSVLALFDDFLANPGTHDTGVFWRLLNLELWLRTYIDAPESSTLAESGGPAGSGGPAADRAARTTTAPTADPDEAAEAKSDYTANPGKQLDLVSEADGHIWRRFPLQTELVARGDDIEARVREHVERFAASLPADALPAGAPWYFVISEKIIAIAQGRSWFTWEITPRPAARVLSRFVTRTPAGIGLGDPTTMELAVREVGLPRVVAASAAGAAGKLIGKRGLFYHVVGADVRAIDGPTPYSAFPSNVSAKLPPKDPDAVSARISAAIRGAEIPAAVRDSFTGTVVMDANDIGRNVLGSDVTTANERLEATFADNPLGQGRQRTPLAILVDLGPA
ncbi:asparagine synthase-related protein [Brachybacterium sp. GCM10030252]|uniref:asparagine synthase-related protein n=1 Tax=Brachybacterium sp. GCM10030252 TaxID=3273380 RepID=UPI003616F7B3